MPMPERDIRAARANRFRPSNVWAGVILVVLVVIGSYLAFAKRVPFTSHGYTVTASFQNAVNIRDKSPVRIAGVDVGEVIEVERRGPISDVTFTVEEDARPVREDAFAAIRPRIFLEGNFFIDLEPGSPSAEELDSGGNIPVTNTSTAVQLDEILTALQAPQRQQLGDLLVGYGGALNRIPTASEDRGQDPEVQGKSGAQALNMAFDYGPTAGRGSAQVTEAFTGTEPYDLRRLIAGANRAFGAVAADEGELQDLIVNWNTFTGALASESAALGQSVEALAPTVESAYASMKSLNAALPPLRTFSLLLEPAVAELPATFRAVRPWLQQAQRLLARRSVGQLADLLQRSTPGFARAAEAGKGALGQLDLLSRCTTDVLVPTGRQEINDPFAIGQPSEREFFYALVDLAGEAQNFDGNGAYLRVQPGGGDTFARAENPGGFVPRDRVVWGNTQADPTGTQPKAGPKPPYAPRSPCYRQAVSDLNGPASAVGPPSPSAATP
jgi:phospholipid/cholesterol/gamma-HCH transport system substrate-binding protein